LSNQSTVAFWDERFKGSDVQYASQGKLPNHLDKGVAFFGPVEGKRVLDIGCGLGENSIALARMGADVTAVDTSTVAVAKLNRFAADHRLSIDAAVCDAMNIGTLGEFDFVVGAMILHHLEPFEAFCSALDSAMKPGGKAFFFENNAASRLLVWCRQNLVGRFGIPKYGDENEFPLTPQEVDALRRRFRVTQDYPEMGFFILASVYLLKRRGEGACRRLDGFLFKRGILKSRSYRQILMVEKLA
jgi:SAM-dependent methyltransferase